MAPEIETAKEQSIEADVEATLRAVRAAGARVASCRAARRTGGGRLRVLTSSPKFALGRRTIGVPQNPILFHVGETIMAIDAPAPIVKAYARLTSLRDNIKTGDPSTPRILVDEFNEALAEMKAGGYDIADFAIPESKLFENWGGMEVHTVLFKSRIDAAILCFRIDDSVEQIRVGFEPPHENG